MTVDGVTARLGDRVDPDAAEVRIDGVPLPVRPGLATWLLYKPTGVVSTMDDPQGRPTVRDLVPAEPVTKPVGRLDLHSEGLMLMTNDGELALIVTHPRYEVPKTYQALIEGSVPSTSLTALTAGVDLDDGPARARSARVVSSHSGRSIVEVVMTEGRKREVRRMFESLDLPIAGLVRTAVGPITDRNLTPGGHRALTDAEIASLYDYARDLPLHG